MIAINKISYLAWLFVGLSFVFSALTKALDFFTVTTYVESYSIALNLHLPEPLYAICAIMLIGGELLIGFLMMLNVFKHYVIISVFIALTSFLILTLYTAISNGLNDCGCFGSVIIVTPWISFIKNCILIIIAIIAYPQSSIAPEIRFKRTNLTICFSTTILLCLFSVLNQPLLDSSNFSIGDKLYFTGSKNSIDVELTELPEIEPRTFGLMRKIDKKRISELKHYIDNATNVDGKPIVITSAAGKDIHPDIYEHFTIWFIDNSLLRNIITTNWGIITLDNNHTITNKWQKDNLNIQSYGHVKDDKFSYSRILYKIVWTVCCALTLYYVIIYIIRGSRKTYQRVGTYNHKQ